MRERSVVVLGGGFSPERNVSMASAANIALQLRRASLPAVVVDLSGGVLTQEQETAWLSGSIADAPSLADLAALKRNTDVFGLLQSPLLLAADVVFPIIHGTFGEDGHLQALLETAGLAYVGSDYIGQALAMNKHLAKQLFAQNQIPTPPWVRLLRGETPSPALQFPCVVKPASAGSSLGVTICAAAADLTAALERAFAFDSEVLIERFIAGREFTIGVLGRRALAIGEIRASGDFDYAAKYRAASTREIFPADLPGAVASRAADLALAVTEALRLRHYCRIDFILANSGEIYILEANAAPGMTQKSLYPQSAEAAGLSFAQVCADLCAMARTDRVPS